MSIPERDTLGPVEAAQFFEDVLPGLARGRAADFPALASTAIVAVGTRAWTCTLHDDETPVKPGVDRALLRAAPAARRVTTKRTRKARKEPGALALELWLDEGAFQALLAGTLDEDRAIRERRIGYRGDLRWLEQLGRMLAGAGDAAAVRGR
jgi:hypothetical protein